jgi:hypothetical protein
MLEIVFPSDNGGVVADAVSTWVMNGVRELLGSLACYIAKR